MKGIFKLAAMASLIVLNPKLAWANNPPAPALFLAEISILPIMMLLTALGGGYAVLEDTRDKRRGCLLAAGAGALVFISMAHEGFAFMVCVTFSFAAIVRGFKMVALGIAAGSKKKVPENLEKASPKLLVSFGALLVIVSIFLGGFAFAFIGYFARSPRYTEETLETYMTYNIANARIVKERTGEMRFLADIPAYYPPGLIGRTQSFQLEYSQDYKSFVVYVLPIDKFPFFPYNYLVSLPSYRGDDSGQIRMIHTHNEQDRCPADAPVVNTISEEAILEAMAEIRGMVELRSQ